jgi:hypothetical protein
MGSLLAFVSAHPIVAGLTAWLLANLAFAAIWHHARARYREIEYQRDLISLELASLEQLCDNGPSDISEVPTLSGSPDLVRVA